MRTAGRSILSHGTWTVKDAGRRLRAPIVDLSIAGCLLILVLAVYFPVRHFDFILFDDEVDVYRNDHVMSGLNLDNLRWAAASRENANWIPLTRISFLADRQRSGARDETTPRDVSARPYHWTNVLLHAAGALLLFGLLKRMTGASGPSAFVAFFFALHPQHVESVAWVAERKDVLSGVFWMLALWSYVRYASRRKIGPYLLTLLLYCLAFMAKPMAVTLPAVLLLVDVWPLRRFPFLATPPCRQPVRGLLWEKLPFFVLALAMSVTTYVVQQQGGAVRTLADLPLGTRMGNAVISAAVYLAKTVWPTGLALAYPPTPQAAWQVIVAGLVLAAITILALRSVRTRPYLFVGWFWYLITLLPVIGIIQVGQQARADRYTYIPTIGLFLMLAWSGADAWQRWPGMRPALAGLCGALCVAGMYLTGTQIAYWENTKTVFARSIAVTGPNAIAHIELGNAWAQDKMTGQAIAEYRQALAIGPPAPATVGVLSNLGTMLYLEGRYSEALGPLTRAVQLKPADSSLHSDLGEVLIRLDRAGEAVAQFEAAIRLKPDDWETHIRLGNALASLGRQDEAQAQFSLNLQNSPPSTGPAGKQ